MSTGIAHSIMSNAVAYQSSGISSSLTTSRERYRNFASLSALSRRQAEEPQISSGEMNTGHNFSMKDSSKNGATVAIDSSTAAVG